MSRGFVKTSQSRPPMVSGELCILDSGDATAVTGGGTVEMRMSIPRDVGRVVDRGLHPPGRTGPRRRLRGRQMGHYMTGGKSRCIGVKKRQDGWKRGHHGWWTT